MKTYELATRYDAVASFYGKATVEEQDNGDLHLISYTTHVATIKDGEDDLGRTEKIAEIYGLYSATTTRHIKEFLQQNYFRVVSTAQVEKDYLVK